VDSLISDGAYLGVGSEAGQLSVEVQNRCGSGPVSSTWLEPLSSVPRITYYEADTAPCASVTAFVQVDSIPGATYRWTLPPDWLGSGTAHMLEYKPGYVSGNIRVQVRNACGPGDTLDLAIEVKTVPGETQILTAKEKPCTLTVQEFYVAPLEDHSYQWSTIDDWTIEGGSEGDTVRVFVGAESSFLFVDVTNKCGSRLSNKLYLTSPLPDTPSLKVTDSDYKGYRLISVSNPSAYSTFQWYRNGLPIESSQGTEAEYVAHLPGIYTIGVSNSEGCELIQEVDNGIEFDQENQDYSIYTGQFGDIVVLNHTSEEALLNIYDFSGKLRSIHTLDPGYNEVPFRLSGTFIVRVSGSGNTLTNKVFTY
jgi:hypothetical protein